MSYFKVDEWNIVEEAFVPEQNAFCESIFCLSNEYMGLRGMLEEGVKFEKTFEGSYIAGVYIEEALGGGFWRRPEDSLTTKRIVCTTNWIGMELYVNGQKINPAPENIREYNRTLSMKEGILSREYIYKADDGKETYVQFQRFLSMDNSHIGAIRCTISPINYSGDISAVLTLNGYPFGRSGTRYWVENSKGEIPCGAYVAMDTINSGFTSSVAMKVSVNKAVQKEETTQREGFVSYEVALKASQGEKIVIDKIVSVCSSRDFAKEDLVKASIDIAETAAAQGFDTLFDKHRAVWRGIWEENDITIEGNPKSQQGIRYCIFQMNQTYIGKDPRINIAPKGLTSEFYQGQTFWDTETYMIPYYIYTNPKAAKNLVMYRYNTLEKAVMRSKKYFLEGARYPMCTMDGDEHCIVWEFSQGEIHVSAAVAYGAYLYIELSKDEEFLAQYGLEMLMQIARYYVSRSSYSEYKGGYVINGVTGPDEYHAMVNNNYYTNAMASWSIEYAMTCIDRVAKQFPKELERVYAKINFAQSELDKWKDVVEKMYYPHEEKIDVFPQDDGYLYNEYVEIKDLPEAQIPLYSNWPAGKIMRSSILKQPDVVLLMFMLSDRYDFDTKKRNYDFYAPRTIHDSSLSVCIHSIMASELGYRDEAYDFYLRTARMDLDDINKNTPDGLHTPSISGTWMSVVNGFGGMRYKSGVLYFDPYVPDQWDGYTFRVVFGKHLIFVAVNKSEATFKLLKGDNLSIQVRSEVLEIAQGKSVTVETRKR